MITVIDMNPKFPDESLDYSADFASRLVTGETITDKTVTVTRGSAVASSPSISGSKVGFWLAGGVVGDVTLVKVSAVTNNAPPRTHEVLLRIPIANPGN